MISMGVTGWPPPPPIFDQNPKTTGEKNSLSVQMATNNISRTQPKRPQKEIFSLRRWRVRGRLIAVCWALAAGYAVIAVCFRLDTGKSRENMQIQNQELADVRVIAAA